MRRRHGLVLAVLLLVLLGVPAALTVVTGGLSIPHNDAWSHSLIAQRWARSGQLELVGWNRPALVGQVLLFGPFGAWVSAQQAGVLLLGALGLVAAYGFLRPRTGPRRALFGVAVLAAVPEFGLLATSFMTDVPAFAGIAGCLWLADRAGPRRRRGSWLLVASVLVGAWAATVREQSVAAPLAVLLVALVRSRGSRRLLPAGLLVALAAGLAGLEQWRRSLPGDDPPHPAAAWDRLVPGLAGGLLVLALYLLPALLLVVRPARWPARAWVPAGIVAVAGTGFVCLSPEPLLQNTLNRRGAYASAALGLRDVLPVTAWGLVLVAAVLATGLLAGHVAAGGLRVRGAAALFGWLTGLGLVVQLAAGQGLFSRYLLPLLLPLLAGLLARPRRRAVVRRPPPLRVPVPRAAEVPDLVAVGSRVALLEPAGDVRVSAPVGVAVEVVPALGPAWRRPAPSVRPVAAPPRPVTVRPALASARSRSSCRSSSRLPLPNVAAAGAALAGTLALSWTLTASTLAYDAARWRAAQDLVDRGVPARDIDAGLEWVGTHSGAPARRGTLNREAVSWYARMFPGVRSCYLIGAGGGRPPGELVAQPPFTTYAVTGRERLWVVRTGWCDRAETPGR